MEYQEIVIVASPRREILELRADPPIGSLDALVGLRAGGASRAALEQALGHLRGGLAYQLLDDFAGASLVAGWAWSRWVDDFGAALTSAGAQGNAGRSGEMTDICTGFAAGSSALTPTGGADHSRQSATPVGPLVHPNDVVGWHGVTKQDGAPGMRRARRLDVWREGDAWFADVGFQDSATSPAGGRIAVHEYHVTASFDRAALMLTSLDVDPRILPYRECPGAIMTARRMVGEPVANLRENVLVSLSGALGCTHLNDVLRSLTDVPVLVSELQEAAL